MGQMKQMVMDAEDRIYDEALDRVDECKSFVQFNRLVWKLYEQDDLTMSYCNHGEEYIQETASAIWHDDLGKE